jgi:hypothetical protein
MKRIIIFISLETYLRNWIDAKAFKSIESNYEVLYVIPEYDWDISKIEKYGILNYKVIKQDRIRMFLFRRILMVTMFRFAKKSLAFRIKISYFSKKMWIVHKIVSLNGLFQIFVYVTKKILGRWNEFDDILRSYDPDLIIAPSLMADSFTIDMTYTANLRKVKSLILINSWDNLISKGVVPIQPTHLGVWGEQAVKQAIEVQNISRDKIKILGVPRFENYRVDNLKSKSVYDRNGIPLDKKIILYASTSLPFDDVSILRLLDNEISSNPKMQDYVVLFRPHPEMMWRVDEVNILEQGFNNVYLDDQIADFYLSRFNYDNKEFSSSINTTDLSYYPDLLSTISAMVCPATTLSLEGLMNGKPCLMICFNDGKNKYLPPAQVAKYENVQQILSLKGVLPCYEEGQFLKKFNELIEISKDSKNATLIADGTKDIIYKDEVRYEDRLLNFVNHIIESV